MSIPTNLEPGRIGIKPDLAVHSLTISQRLMVMLLNYIPLLHVLSLAATLFISWANISWRIAGAMAGLYLLPALIARVIVKGFPIRSQMIVVGSTDFMKWWALLSLQMLFCRLPILEESLRVVPAAYSAWLRLWGAQIGRLVFWSPGTYITDRSFLQIGDDVIFGTEVRLTPHIMTRNADGSLEVILAPIKIGDRVIVGGYSILAAGTEMDADQETRARLISYPFNKWRNGQRVKE